MRKVEPNLRPEAQLSAAAVRRLEERYARLKQELLALGWIAQGTLLLHPPAAWRLTRKHKAKTVTLALSAQQAALYEQAIANHRKLETILRQMRELSEQVLQNSVPGVRKRGRQKHPKPRLS
ncbi:MAG: DUF6788 family protein [Verrucomicrobiales bacterium]